VGLLAYDNSTRVEFDDRLLAHLEVVIISKLRRREAFAMSWRESSIGGGGRSTLWLDPAIPLRFRFDGLHMPALDRGWVDRLASSAASSTGLIVTDENGVDVPGTTIERSR
jgi:hypothetical protein